MHLLGRLFVRRQLIVLQCAFVIAISPSIAVACSMGPPWGRILYSPTTIYMIGSAMRDTLPAGSGDVEFGMSRGHFGNAVAKPIFGQVVSVSQVSGRAPAAFRRAVAAHGDRVVLVPWDYGPDCSPVQWAGSARWMADTTSGLFGAVLRDKKHWVDEIPTLDVHRPQFVSYPAAARQHGILLRTPPPPDSMLTASQLLQLNDVMPSHEDLEKRLDTAAAPLRAWIASHPELATQYPVPEAIRGIDYLIAHTLVTRRPVPLAGTYRVTIVLHDKDSLTYYARTSERPNSVLRGAEAKPASSTERGSGSTSGVYVLACAARSIAEFSGRKRCHFGQPPVTQGYFAFADSVSASAPGLEERQGSIDLLDSSHSWEKVFAGDTTSMAFFVRAAAEISAAKAAEPRSFMKGYFRKTRGGQVTYERLVLHGGSVVVRIRAERLSGETFSES